MRRWEIGLTSLRQKRDTTTPGGRLVFPAFAALAEFIRELIVIGTGAGLDAGRGRGRGRAAGASAAAPAVVGEKILSMACDLPPNPDHCVASIVRMLGVPPGTVPNRITDLRQVRASERLRRQLEAVE